MGESYSRANIVFKKKLKGKYPTSNVPFSTVVIRKIEKEIE